MNYNDMEVNPNASKKQRQDAEVKSLLTKLQPDMISLNPDFVGSIMPSSQATSVQTHRLEAKANSATGKVELKHKKRGKSSSMKRYLRKQSNVIDAKREAVRERLEKRKQFLEKQQRKAKGELPDTFDALKRFNSKPRF
jgi:U3 small nucleolar RNA-associated protein 7